MNTEDKVRKINKENKKRHEKTENTLGRLEKKIENLKKKDWFDKLGLACSIIGLILTIMLYRLGHDYTVSMNNVKYQISNEQIPKIEAGSGNKYFTLTPYLCYPMRSLNNSGSVTDIYLFNLNWEKDLEAMKITKSKDPIPKKLKAYFVSDAKNVKLKNSSAYIQEKNSLGCYSGTTIYEKSDEYDMRLYLYDPSYFSGNSDDYIGIYAMALRGKNDNFQVVIFGTKLANTIQKKDKTEVFYDIDVYDEKKWDKSILNRKDAVLLYEKTIDFLDSKLPY